MAFISDNDLNYTSFTPKVGNQFILYMDGIPAYMIKKIQRPTIEFGDIVLDHINLQRKLKGKASWGDIAMSLYDPIDESAAAACMEWIRTSHEPLTGRDGYANMYKRTLNINVIGPPGDVVEHWELQGAYVKSAVFGELDWSNDQPVQIDLTIRIDRAILTK